jgi:hypothetical protein
VSRAIAWGTGSRLSPGFTVVDQQILQALKGIESAVIVAMTWLLNHPPSD